MARLSLKIQLLEHLAENYPAIIHGAELEILGMEWGHKASNAGRKCRELVNEGKIERIPDEKGRVQYRWLPTITGNISANRIAVKSISAPKKLFNLPDRIMVDNLPR